MKARALLRCASVVLGVILGSGAASSPLCADNNPNPDPESEKIRNAFFCEPTSCKFEDADVRQVISFFKNKTGIGIISDEAALAEIKQKITVQLDNLAPSDALRRILQQLGLDLRQTRPGSTVIFISTQRTIAIATIKEITSMPKDADKVQALRQALTSGNSYLEKEAKSELQKRGFRIQEDKDGKYTIVE